MLCGVATAVSGTNAGMHSQKVGFVIGDWRVEIGQRQKTLTDTRRQLVVQTTPTTLLITEAIEPVGLRLGAM